MEEALLAARFPFLRDGVFLVAEVNKTTGRQVLRMQHVDPNTQEVLHEDALDCIHAAVCDIPVEEFAETIQEEDFAENVLRIRSSEQLQEINLAPGEKFVALRSWVAGIAEAGMNAFAIQAEIDIAANLQFPVTSRLLRFLSSVDPAGFLPSYFEYVDRMSLHEGVRERSYLIACLLPVVENLSKNNLIQNREQIIAMIFAMDPPPDLFTSNHDLFPKLARENPTFLHSYLSRVSQIYAEKRGGGEEWLNQVLNPVLLSLDWAIESEPTESQRLALWHEILALDPPPELFSGFGTLFRFFALRDPEFLPQYMRRVRVDRVTIREGDDLWLTSVLRPILTTLDFVSNSLIEGFLDLWEDVLALDPPVDFLVENWKTVTKLARLDLGILQRYVAWIRRLWEGSQVAGADKLVAAISPVIGTLIDLGDTQAAQQLSLWHAILALDLPRDQLPADVARMVEERLAAGEDS